jgi:WD40 repeat protein
VPNIKYEKRINNYVKMGLFKSKPITQKLETSPDSVVRIKLPDFIHTIAFSSDLSQYVISVGNTIQHCNVATKQRITFFYGHLSSSLAFSPDGRKIASGSENGNIRIWNFASRMNGEVLHVDYEEIVAFLGHMAAVNSVVFSPDGSQLASCSDDGTIIIWDIATNRQIVVFRGHRSHVNTIAYSPDGSQIVSGSHDRTVRLWNIATQRQFVKFKGHSDTVNSVAFSSDGRQIVSGSDDETVRSWDVKTQREIRVFRGHSNVVNSVAFSPDGCQIVSGSADGTF